jgi:hypothetical protein
MIARTWLGWTRTGDADACVEYLLETGIKEFEDLAGDA